MPSNRFEVIASSRRRWDCPKFLAVSGCVSGLTPRVRNCANSPCACWSVPKPPSLRTKATFVEARPGKRVALLSLNVERAWQKAKREFRLVVQVPQRTIDKKGQRLLVPEIELSGWWTSLDIKADEVITLYKHHGTHEQFHSEIKSDLDLERLPSGKFATNDAIIHLASFAYNCLRLLGQLGLTGEIAPIRHPAKRRRLKTVLQEIMYRAAKCVEHACRLVLDFGRGVAAHTNVFIALQERLLRAASP